MEVVDAAPEKEEEATPAEDEKEPEAPPQCILGARGMNLDREAGNARPCAVILHLPEWNSRRPCGRCNSSPILQRQILKHG